MSKIKSICARQVLDSRGMPTVEVDVVCGDGVVGTAIVPSGASTGKFEAHELRDGDPTHYDGRGVLRAVEHVRQQIAPRLLGMDPADQLAIDRLLCELDGTPNKNKLGANALLGVSLAVAHAAAAVRRVPRFQHLNQLWNEFLGRTVRPQMPLPMVNMISGGLHAGGNLDFQDFLILPVGASHYHVGLEWIVRVYRRLGRLLTEAGFEGRLVGDEGGYGPRLTSNEQAAELIVRAIEAADLTPGSDVALALDVASTHFFDGSCYRLSATGGAQLTAADMIDVLERMVERYPIISIEDGLAENDWTGWQLLTQRLGQRVRLVGDDLFTTSPDRVSQGIETGAANAVLVKVNQIGTLTETMQTMKLAVEAGMTRVVSARSGETEDTTIADLAVAVAAEQIKIGSIQRSERLAKYNRLLRIEEMLDAAN